MLNSFLYSEIDFEQQKIVIRVHLYPSIPAKKTFCRTVRHFDNLFPYIV
jgi:hypothetical protein